jgi:hypothetical protein
VALLGFALAKHAAFGTHAEGLAKCLCDSRKGTPLEAGQPLDVRASADQLAQLFPLAGDGVLYPG